MTETKAAWRINPETPSVIITPHGRIAINWSEQFAGGEVSYELAEATAALIVETVNARLASQSLSTDEEGARSSTTDVAELRELLGELHAIVRGECPGLLDEDCGGNAELDMRIEQALQSKDTPSHGG